MSASLLTALTGLAPELILLAGAFLLLLLGLFRGDGKAHELASAGVLILLAAGACAIYQAAQAETGREFFFGGLLVQDLYSRAVRLILFIMAAGALLLAAPSLRTEADARAEYPVLALLAVAGLSLMVMANHLMSFYMALELASLPQYVLAAIRRDQERSTEAGLKYFALGALSSGFILYGSSLVYGFAGTMDFAALAEVLKHGAMAGGLSVGLVLLLTGVFFKVAAVPFHMWTPDVYEGAPTPVTTFLAAVPKLAMLAFLTRLLMEPFLGQLVYWQPILMLVALASMLTGALGAIGQTSLKRLMAYSSIGHVGYILVGLSAGNGEGVHGVLVYLLVYGLMSLGAFGVIFSMRREGEPVEAVVDLAGMSRTAPHRALAFAVILFSMAGIPPMVGFFAKLFVFLAAIEAGLFWLAVLGVLASAVGAYYYLKLVKIMYFDESGAPLDKALYWQHGAVAGAGALLMLALTFYPTPLLDLTRRAAGMILSY